MEKKTKAINNIRLRASFLNDINSLSNAGSKECFTSVVALFKQKWSAIPEAAVPFKHFVKEWLSERLTRFYRGAAEGYAMNNNGLEGTNKTLKDSATMHELMPILEFIPTIKEWISMQSRRRDPENVNCIKLARTPSDLKLKDLTEGCALWKSKIMFVKVENHYIAISHSKTPITISAAKSVYKQYCESSYSSMDKYNSFQKYVHIISPDRRCNCYEFGRNFKCQHATCVKIMIDHIPVPPEAKDVPLGCRRKSGRPPKALGRYTVQRYEVVENDAVSGGEDSGPRSQVANDSKRKKQKTSSSTASVAQAEDDNYYDHDDNSGYNSGPSDRITSASQDPQRGSTFKSAISTPSDRITSASQDPQRGVEEPDYSSDDNDCSSLDDYQEEYI